MNNPGKWKFVKENFSVWEKKDFNQYINTFFLWDYVGHKEGEEKYVVKNLQYSENEEKKSNYITADTIGTYIDNANTYIERRSIFMAGMLMIALEFEYSDEEEVWQVSDIYKLIVDKVFLQDKAYSGYEDVIGKIWETIAGNYNEDEELSNKIRTEIKHILREMCERMDIKYIFDKEGKKTKVEECL